MINKHETVFEYLKKLSSIYDWETVFSLISKFHMNYINYELPSDVREAYFSINERERTILLIKFCEWRVME